MALCGDDVAAPDAAYAWAVTRAWRGDARLFARIARKAINELSRRGLASDCCIEFSVRRDVESYQAVDEFLDRVPASTLRSFRSARIRVGSPSFLVEIKFGRKPASEESLLPCMKGVAIEVASDNPDDGIAVSDIRQAITSVVERGGFARASPPTEGPTEQHPDLEAALQQRERIRWLQVQLVFAGVTVLTFLVGYLVFRLVTSEDKLRGFTISLENLSELFVIVLPLAQVASFALSGLIFPAIEIADVTPGRRILRVVGQSGLITIATGLIGAYLKQELLG